MEVNTQMSKGSKLSQIDKEDRRDDASMNSYSTISWIHLEGFTFNDRNETRQSLFIILRLQSFLESACTLYVSVGTCCVGVAVEL
jgi:hypothetical protein